MSGFALGGLLATTFIVCVPWTVAVPSLTSYVNVTAPLLAPALYVNVPSGLSVIVPAPTEAFEYVKVSPSTSVALSCPVNVPLVITESVKLLLGTTGASFTAFTVKLIV